MGLSLALVSTESASAQPEVDVAALVVAYSGLLYRVAHSVVRSPAEAEDVVQEVFLRVLTHRGKLSEVREMRVWLVRIAWHLALDRRRRVRPEQIDAAFAERLVSKSLAADRLLDEAERLQTVLAEVERLPKGERHALLLSAFEELGTAEMAAVLSKSESAVRALLFRARTRLRERLEKGGKR